MAIDTTTPVKADALNALAPVSDFFSGLFNSVTNTFSKVTHSAEEYLAAVLTADMTKKQAEIDAQRQAILNPAPQPGAGLDTNTMLLLGLGAVALVLLVRK